MGKGLFCIKKGWDKDFNVCPVDWSTQIRNEVKEQRLLCYIICDFVNSNELHATPRAHSIAGL
jgi:hypothetical protein